MFVKDKGKEDNNDKKRKEVVKIAKKLLNEKGVREITIKKLVDNEELLSYRESFIINALKEDDYFNISNTGTITKNIDEMAGVFTGNSKEEVLLYFMEKNHFVKNEETHELYKLDTFLDCYVKCDDRDYDDFISKVVTKEIRKIHENGSVNHRTKRDARLSFCVYKPLNRDIIVFDNGFLNTRTGEFEDRNCRCYDKEIPYYAIDYDYNPEAEYGEAFSKYWNNYSEELQQQILEFIGYLLINGNPRQITVFLVGIGATGKSTLVYILENVLKNTSSVKLESIIKSRFGKTGLIGSNVNFSNDSKMFELDDNSLLKQFTGGDTVEIEAKFQDPVYIKPENVPVLVTICNNLPRFNKWESALIRRLAVIEFNTKHKIPIKERNDDLKYQILNEDNSIEWLIYNSLQAVKPIIEDNYTPDWFMMNKNNSEVNDIIGKASNPLRYYLNLGFELDSEYYGIKRENDNDNSYNENKIGQGNFTNYVTKEEMQNYLEKCRDKDMQEISEIRNGEFNSRAIMMHLKNVLDEDRYKTRQKKVDGVNQRVYPFLLKTKYYYDVTGEKADYIVME